MDISLTGQGFMFGLTLIETLLVVYVLSRMSRRWRYKVLPAIAVFSAVMAIAVPYPLERIARAPGEVPAGVSLMAVPMVIGLGLMLALYVQRIHWWHMDRRRKAFARPFRRSYGWHIYGLSLVAASGGILLSLAFLNGYYRLYPTVGSVIGRDTTPDSKFGPASLQYSGAGHRVRRDTMEAALYPLQKTKLAGTIKSVSIPGEVSHFNSQPGFVYTPPVAASGDVQLPVIVLMAGTPGLPHDWLRGGQLRQTTDAFASAHNGITPYIFIVDANGSAIGDTECVDSPRGNVETFLSQDVPDYIKSHYNVSPDPGSWAIGGLSLGGTCGIMTALRHPDVYNYFLDFAGDSGPSLGSQKQTIQELFGGSRDEFEAHLPGKLIANGRADGVGGYFANATHDDPGALIGTRTLALAAHKAGMDTAYRTVPGHHSYEAWSQNYRDALPWISNRLGATDCTGTCTQ